MPREPFYSLNCCLNGILLSEYSRKMREKQEQKKLSSRVLSCINHTSFWCPLTDSKISFAKHTAPCFYSLMYNTTEPNIYFGGSVEKKGGTPSKKKIISALHVQFLTSKTQTTVCSCYHLQKNQKSFCVSCMYNIGSSLLVFQ